MFAIAFISLVIGIIAGICITFPRYEKERDQLIADKIDAEIERDVLKDQLNNF